MIIRGSKNRNYSVISNTILRDSRLSWKARGIAAYLLSQPDDWSINSTHLWRSGKEGRDSVRNALTELSNLGYLHRTKRQDKLGHWSTELHLTEKPTPENQASENQASENQASENQALYQVLNIPSTNIPSTNIPSTNIPSTKPPPPQIVHRSIDNVPASGGGGFHSRLAVELIEKYLPTWNNPDGYTATLTGPQIRNLCEWLWLVRLLYWSEQEANHYTDYTEQERIENLYGAVFAGVRSEIAVIRKHVAENAKAPLDLDDLNELEQELHAYEEEANF